MWTTPRQLTTAPPPTEESCSLGRIHIEWRNPSHISHDNSSHTILTRGSEFLMDWTSWSQTWSTNTTTTSRKPLRRRLNYSRWKRNVFAFASQSKAKAKPRRSSTAYSSTRTVPICERFWTDIEPGTYSHIAFPVSKRLSTLFVMVIYLTREDDGAIEFWRCGQKTLQVWEFSTLVWWNVEEQNGRRRRQEEKISILYWLHQDKKFFISELFKVIQDAIPLILHYRTMY